MDPDDLECLRISASRRRRTKILPEQQAVLEGVFLHNPFPNATLRARLSSQLQLAPRGVQIWFQNRRVKERKVSFDASSTSSSSSPPHSSSTNNLTILGEKQETRGGLPYHQNFDTLSINFSNDNTSVVTTINNITTTTTTTTTNNNNEGAPSFDSPSSSYSSSSPTRSLFSSQSNSFSGAIPISSFSSSSSSTSSSIERLSLSTSEERLNSSFPPTRKSSQPKIEGISDRLLNSIIHGILADPAGATASPLERRKKNEERFFTACVMGFLTDIKSLTSGLPLIRREPTLGGPTWCQTPYSNHVQQLNNNSHRGNDFQSSSSSSTQQTIEPAISHVNFTDGDGNTPLMVTAARGHLDILNHLLEVGADCSFKNSAGHNALFMAIQHGNWEVANLLLLYSSPDDMRTIDNITGLDSLMLCVQSGVYNLVLAFLQRGVLSTPTTYFDKRGRNYIHVAVENAHVGITKLLLDFKCPVNARDASSRTPLMTACDQGNLPLIKLLLENGASVHTQDKFGMSSLDYAQRNRNEKIVCELLAKRVNQIV